MNVAHASRVAVVGGAGQLGSWLCRLLGERAWGLDLPELDITDRGAVERTLLDAAPAAIVNCAAYTAVDRAEGEAELCWAVNAVAVEQLAAVATSLACPLVQISTDYVFGAAPAVLRPWREEDIPEPRGVYAESKLAGEQAAARAPRYLIVRTCGLYGHAEDAAKGRSFVEAILAKAARGETLRVVDDQRCSPSYARDVAAAVLRLLEAGEQGVFHVTNAGDTTWFEFAQLILKETGYQSSLTAISTAEYGAAAPRPSYSVLDCAKYRRATGESLPSVGEGLADYLRWRGILRGPNSR